MEKMNKIKLLLRLTFKKYRVDNAGNKQDSVMKNNSGELIKIVWWGESFPNLRMRRTRSRTRTCGSGEGKISRMFLNSKRVWCVKKKQLSFMSRTQQTRIHGAVQFLTE